VLKKQSNEALQTLLPFYLNDTLSVTEKQAVEEWLRREPEQQANLATLRRVYSAASGRPQTAPSPAVRQRLIAQMRTTRQLRSVPRWLPWAGGFALAVTLLIALWLIVQPGISLQWTADGPVTAFRVYRAPVGSDNFELMYATPAQPNAQEYTYIDTLIWPSQTYVYRVEGIGQNQPAVSRAITANGQGALPGQIMIVFTSLMAGCCAFSVMRSYLGDGYRLTRPLRI